MACTMVAEGCQERRKDQVKGQLGRIVEAATDDQEMASIYGPSLHPGQDRPVKEALAFGAQALAEALPVPRAKLGGRCCPHH